MNNSENISDSETKPSETDVEVHSEHACANSFLFERTWGQLWGHFRFSRFHKFVNNSENISDSETKHSQTDVKVHPEHACANSFLIGRTWGQLLGHFRFSRYVWFLNPNPSYLRICEISKT